MAGRGRDAVMPAWMKSGGATPAPGAPTPAAAHPVAALPAGPAPAAPAPAPAFRPAFPTGGGPRGPYIAPRPPPIRQEWTEHIAPDGRRYYFNARLNKSAWEKPDELKAPHERAAGASSPASPWAEFTSPDGRKYYYNSVTKESRWTPPDGWPGAPSTAGGSAAAAKGSGNVAGGVHVVPSEAIQTGPTPHYATTAEAKDDFKRLLTDARIPPTLSWEQTSQLIAPDRRFGGLKTMGERRAAFNEYVQQKKNDEAEEARRQRAKAKDAFFQMLDGCTALTAGDATYSEARATLAHDGRWQGVVGEREREDLYLEWLDERERSRREAKKLEERQHRAALRSLLDSSPWVTAATSWRSAQERLAGVDAFDALAKVDRLDVWENFMRDLEKREDYARERQIEERKKQERVNRAVFRELLDRHSVNGTITAATRWKDYYKRIAEEPALRAVEENIAGSRPKELFLDVFEKIEQEYYKHRADLQSAVDAMGAAMPVVAESLLFEEFQASFSAAVDGISDSDVAAAVKSVPEVSLRLFYEELKGRAAKAARRRQDAFLSLLSHTDALGVTSTYEQAQQLCSQAPEWEAIPGGEEERKSLFAEFLQQAEKRNAKRRASSEPEGGGKEASRRDRKERSHAKDRKRRHRSPDSSNSDDDSGDRRRSRRHKKSKHHRRERHRSRSRSRSRSRGRRNEARGATLSDGEVEEGEVV